MICYLNALWCSNGNAYLDTASFSTIASARQNNGTCSPQAHYSLARKLTL